MPAGQRFNPYRQFKGAFIPNWLLERREVSAGAKLAYARLGQHSGKDGECKPGEDILAEELGIGVRQAKRYIAELAEHELVEVERRGLGLTNRYHFLLHPWMDKPPPRSDTSDPSEVTHPTNRSDTSDPSEVTHPSLHEKRVRRRESEKEHQPPSRKRDRAPNLATVEVARVFDAWRTSTGKQRAQLDAKRRKLITTALALGYTVDELCQAVDGWKYSPHYRGENDRRTVYNDLGMLLRDADHIDRFLGFAQGNGVRRASSSGGAVPSHGDNAGHAADRDNCPACGTGRHRRAPGGAP